MLLIAPVFSASGVSVRFRVLLAVLIAALAAPIIPTPPTTDLFSANGLLMAIREVGIGFAIGFVLQLVFGAVVNPNAETAPRHERNAMEQIFIVDPQ